MLMLIAWKSLTQEMLLREPPAAITPKTFVAPSPRNRLIITTQKIETTKKNIHYTKYKKFDLTKLLRKD